MKNTKIALILCIVLSVILAFAVCAYAENSVTDNYSETVVNTMGVNDLFAVVNGQEIKATQNENNSYLYLFLPSSADLSGVVLDFTIEENEELWVYNERYSTQIESGKALDVLAVSNYDSETGYYKINCRIICTDSETETISYNTVKIIVMKSSNIGAMYLDVEDDAYSRSWVDSSPTHSNDAGKMTKVNMVLENADSSIVYNGKLTSLKGRGNTTWTRPKKPYQIKLDKKTDLLDSGDKNNTNKTWVLLASALDKTFIKTALANDIARELGLTETPEYRFVDLYFDGEYRGTYILTEKVQINKGRININELEAENEVADETATAQDTNCYGMTYQYNPTAVCNSDDISGGYLLEQDGAFYAKENSWFKISNSTVIVVKSPEFATKEQVKYVSELFYEMYMSTKNDSFNGKSVIDYVDIDSLAALYAVNEYLLNVDFCASSTYFFLPEEGNDNYEHKFYAGPAWDFDTSLGNRTELDWMRDPTYIFASQRTYFNGSIIKGAIKHYMEKIDAMYPVIFADDNVTSGYITSLVGYKSIVNESQKMNFTIWPFDDSGNTFAKPTYNENFDYVYNFLKTRHNSILPKIAKWSATDYNSVLQCMNGNHSGESYDIEATCTDDGKVGMSCPVCKTDTVVVLPATGHIDDDGDDVCDVCGKKIYSKLRESKFFTLLLQLIELIRKIFGFL